MAERNLFSLSLYSNQSWGVCCGFLQVTQTAAQQHILLGGSVGGEGWVECFIFPHLCQQNTRQQALSGNVSQPILLLIECRSFIEAEDGSD